MADSPDYNYINATGVIVPDTSDIQQTVETEFKAAFGQDLVVTPDTPQGVLITAEVLARDSVVRNNAALANQINPNLAAGIFLDDICALTGITRIPATRSTVTATISGVAGTSIPAGARAQTDQFDVFETTGVVVIGVGGTVNASFRSVEYGPVPCGVGDLTQIITGILGWETVTNAAAATLGQNLQTDQSLRALRKVSLAAQGVALPEAIVSGLYLTEGVRSLTFLENTAATTEVIQGITMIAHSVYACVDGGTDEDVGATLLRNKSLGAGWNGNVTVDVPEPYSGQVYPVKFDRPDQVPVTVRATVTNTDNLVDAATAVKESILAYAAGLLEGEVGFTVGTDVSCFELAGAINSQYPSIFVSKVEAAIIVSDMAPSWSSDTIEIDVNQIASITEADIVVVVS